MEIRREKVLILPVGLYWKRLLKEIRSLREKEELEEVILLWGSKNEEWRKKTRENAQKIMKKAKELGIRIKDVEVDLTSYEESFRKILSIALDKMREAKEVIISVSGATRPSVIAAVAVSIFVGTKVVLTPSSYPKRPEEYPKEWIEEDFGGESEVLAMPVLVYRLIQREDYRGIFEVLHNSPPLSRTGIKEKLEELDYVKKWLGRKGKREFTYRILNKRLNRLMGLGLVREVNSIPTKFELTPAGKLIAKAMFEEKT